MSCSRICATKSATTASRSAGVAGRMSAMASAEVYAADQRAPRRLSAAAAQSATPIACVVPLPFASPFVGQRSLSNDMSPLLLVLPLALLQLQLSFAVWTVETGQ